MAFQSKHSLLLMVGLIVGGSGWYFWPKQQADAAVKPAHTTVLVSTVSASVKPLPITLATQGHVVRAVEIVIRTRKTTQR
ncbi:hypothetical protein VH86_19400 [Pantoea sp. BL1]|uniref:hypothetical protein n=1 Tax=Pantoea sp. BL1 TaxID=1628190 RepID=UPI0005F82DD7|nr:hypothetical protein [Pantoea sp. BL1]KJV46727.1 hypothetical protein VH86_19400 [Pantoea sp. BL1]